MWTIVALCKCLREEVCKIGELDHYCQAHIFIFIFLPFSLFPSTLKITLPISLSNIIFTNILNFLSFYLSFFLSFFLFLLVCVFSSSSHSFRRGQTREPFQQGRASCLHTFSIDWKGKGKKIFFIQTYLCKMLSMDNRNFFLGAPFSGAFLKGKIKFSQQLLCQVPNTTCRNLLLKENTSRHFITFSPCTAHCPAQPPHHPRGRHRGQARFGPHQGIKVLGGVSVLPCPTKRGQWPIPDREPSGNRITEK